MSLCLNFVSCNSHINKIIVGVDSIENLNNNIQALGEVEQVKVYVEKLKIFSEEDVNILFPHFWKIGSQQNS